MLREAARHTRARIRLLDGAGYLLADSHRRGPPEGRERSPPTLLNAGGRLSRASLPAQQRSTTPADELSARREVRRALAGGYGSATRLYKNGGRLFLFSALPIATTAGPSAGVVYLTRSTNPVRAARYRLRTTLLQIFAATVAFATFIALFLAATISRPLGRLTRDAEAIAAGDLSRALRLERRDELGQLARAFAAMKERLLGRAQEAAELAADLSHEFKSPLTGIRGAAELLLEGAADDPAARERFLRTILGESRRLDRLVTRLLELSRLEADAGAPGLLDARALTAEVFALYEERPVDLDWRLDGRAGDERLHGRAPQLTSALCNLLDNALAHARAGTRVRVVASSRPGRLRWEVWNQGAPIALADQERIWDRFFTTRGDQGGSGLGLPIVRAVARRHGGGCGVASSAEAGTCFWLELPAVRGSLEAASPAVL
jgi:two-component system sensor histidine kinase ChvG